MRPVAICALLAVSPRGGRTMAIYHASSGEPISVQPLGAGLAEAKSIALFKSAQLEVVRMVLLAGKAMPVHQVPGEITLQCIEGALTVLVDGRSQVLRAGQLMFLSGRVAHGVQAVENSSALLTIVLPA